MYSYRRFIAGMIMFGWGYIMAISNFSILEGVISGVLAWTLFYIFLEGDN